MLRRWSAAGARLTGLRGAARSPGTLGAWGARRMASVVPSYLLTLPETRVTRLSNGIRVASEMNSPYLVTVGVWIDAGSRYETSANNGTAHCLEHLNFKGSSRRSKIELEKGIENKGAHLNAYTSREMTAYYMEVLKRDLDFGLDVLSDMLLHSNYDSSAIENEKPVIIREAKEIFSMKEELVMDLLHEAAYRGSGLGLTILGTEECVMRLTRRHLLDYIRTHYTGNRIVVAASGAVEHDELVSLVSKYFGSVPAYSNPSLSNQYSSSDVRLADDYPSGHVAMSFEGAGWKSSDNIPLLLLQMILGSWDRVNGDSSSLPSPLARRVSSARAGHSFSTFNSCYKDTGLFGVYALPDSSRRRYAVGDDQDLPQLTKAVLGSFRDCFDTLSESDLMRAKEKLFASLVQQLDGSTPICEDIGRELLTYDRRIPLPEIYSRIYDVSLTDLKDTLQRYCGDRSKLSVGATGAISRLPNLDDLKSYL